MSKRLQAREYIVVAGLMHFKFAVHFDLNNGRPLSVYIAQAKWGYLGSPLKTRLTDDEQEFINIEYDELGEPTSVTYLHTDLQWVATREVYKSTNGGYWSEEVKDR